MAWVSRIFSDQEYAQPLGLSAKYYGHEWDDKPAHIPPHAPDLIKAALSRHNLGETLRREEYPEASYVFSEKHFSTNIKDFFYLDAFLAVKGKLARILQTFNLGEGGGLIPYPIYQKDKTTPYKGEFFLLNFGKGCQKDTFLSEESNLNAFRSRRTEEQHGYELWATFSQNGDDFALSDQALSGPDLWFEEKIKGCVFVSDRLAQMLNEARLNVDFKLSKCRIVGGENKE